MRATQSTNTQHAANLQPPLANPELQRRDAASVRQHTQAAERWCWSRSLGGLFFFRVRQRTDGGATAGQCSSLVAGSSASELHPVGEQLVAHTMRESPIRLQRRMTSRVAARSVMQSFINSVE
jgi:hypothetical protein